MEFLQALVAGVRMDRHTGMHVYAALLEEMEVMPPLPTRMARMRRVPRSRSTCAFSVGRFFLPE